VNLGICLLFLIIDIIFYFLVIIIIDYFSYYKNNKLFNTYTKKVNDNIFHALDIQEDPVGSDLRNITKYFKYRKSYMMNNNDDAKIGKMFFK